MLKVVENNIKILMQFSIPKLKKKSAVCIRKYIILLQSMIFDFNSAKESKYVDILRKITVNSKTTHTLTAALYVFDSHVLYQCKWHKIAYPTILYIKIC